MKQRFFTTKHMVLTGMMTALVSVLSILNIPTPSGVPITLQTFAMAFCGYVLGWKLGGLASLLYLILGAVGVPVYAGMNGGVAALMGLSGGFIFGFIPMTMLCGAGIRKGFRGKALVLGALGLVICHCFGIVQFSVLTGNSLAESALLVSVPYLAKDIVSVVGAHVAAIAVRRALTASSLMSYGEAA